MISFRKKKLMFFGQNNSIRGATDLELSDMAEKLGLKGAEKDVLLRSLKEKVAKLASGGESSNNEKGENVFSDVRKVLTSTLGVTAANEILSSAESALGITNLSKADVEKKKMLLSNILTQDVFSKQSYQKRLILEDKLKAILL